VFIDETWAKTNMTRRYGRCRRGARLVAKVPHGRWRTLTFLAALRHDRITAPCVIDGPINGASFRAYIEQFLVPTLSPGDVVVMDNLGSHKGKAVREVLGFTVKARDRIESSGLGVPINLVYLDLGGTVVELIEYQGCCRPSSAD
jgi:hypothetical protein